MKGIFGRFIAIILLVILIFVLPLVFLIAKTKHAEDVYAREVVEAFLDDMVRDGKVTVEEWEKMLQDLARNGVLYDIEVSVGEPQEWDKDE